MPLISRLALATVSAGAVLLLAAARGSGPAADSRGLSWGRATPQSLGAMTFGPDGTLFVADSRGAAVFAFDPADGGQAVFKDRLMTRGLDAKVAATLGTTPDRIRFNDMVVHPKSGNIYFTVTRLEGETSQPVLIRLAGAETVEVVDLDRIKFATAAVPAAPSRDAKTPWGQPQWTLTVTDIQMVDGELLVAGLSNEQFASALRRLPFPFGKPGTLNTVEIYHTSHDKWETAAPIEAFLPITIGGTPVILAGYGCSPIATFARADLKTAQHLKGRTVAELGGGNRPIDIVRYLKDGKEWILIANNNRTLMRIDPADIAKAPEMTKPVSQAYQPGGVGYLPVASTGVMQIDDYNADQVAVLLRDTESGAVNLVGLAKKWL